MNSKLSPPSLRTHLGQEMSAAVQPNSLNLQRCEQCNTVQYPPREVCRRCLSDKLSWQPVESTGLVMTSTTLNHSLEPWFSERAPWLMGSVSLDCGALVLAHLAPDCAGSGSSVRVIGVKDLSGQAVLVGVPQSVAREQTTALAQQLIGDNS